MLTLIGEDVAAADVVAVVAHAFGVMGQVKVGAVRDYPLLPIPLFLWFLYHVLLS